MSPLPGQYAWDAGAFEEICALERLRCVPGLAEAFAAAENKGLTIDGGEDPHWNALGHELAGRAILDYLRQEVLDVPGSRPAQSQGSSAGTRVQRLLK